MKKIIAFPCILGIIPLLSSCSAIGGIFKAGVWVGVLGIVLVIGLIIFIVRRSSNKN